MNATDPAPSESDRPAVAPPVSVVVPVYNDADSLTELVDRIIAVFAQREPGPIEVILVDDASPDGSWAVIRELAATKVGVRGLSLRSNVGPILAVAAGSHHATSEVIACIDADLEIQPEVLPQVVLGIHQGADLVSGVRTQRVGLPPVRRLGTRVVRLLGALRWSEAAGLKQVVRSAEISAERALSFLSADYGEHAKREAA